MNRERLLIAAFLVLTATLIVGQRFGFTWAGGTGYETPLYATALDGSHIARGQTVRTADDFARLDLASYGTVWMDQKTNVTIERLSKKEIVLRVDTGRVAVNAGAVPIEVRMDVISARMADTLVTLINYDQWRRVTVLPINGSVEIWHRGETPNVTEAPADILYDMPGMKPASNKPPFDAPEFEAWVRSAR